MLTGGCASPQQIMSPVKKGTRVASKRGHLSIYNDMDMSLNSVNTPSCLQVDSSTYTAGNGVLILALKDLFAKIS